MSRPRVMLRLDNPVLAARRTYRDAAVALAEFTLRINDEDEATGGEGLQWGPRGEDHINAFRVARKAYKEAKK